MSAQTDTLDLLRESPFFEGMEREHLEHFAGCARRETFEAGEPAISQGNPASVLYVLDCGKIELSFAKAGAEMDGHTLPHIVGHRGYPVGWASLVGLVDDVVPAPTVYAGHLGGPHEVVELPVSRTELPEEKLWDHFEAYWLRLALGGVPEDFGEKDPPTT